LCRKFSEIIIRFDVNGRVVPLSIDEFLERNENGIGHDELKKDLHIVNTNGDVLKGSIAMQKLITLLPFVRPMQWMLKSYIGKGVVDVTYGAIKSFRRCYYCNKRRKL
jgi:predicted DCC family thiol-disulfide oxidoreductase YuxK